MGLFNKKKDNTELNKEVFGEYVYIVDQYGFDLSVDGLTKLATMLRLNEKADALLEDEQELLDVIREELGVCKKFWSGVKTTTFKSLDMVERGARKGKEKLTSEEYVTHYDGLRKQLSDKKKSKSTTKKEDEVVENDAETVSDEDVEVIDVRKSS